MKSSQPQTLIQRVLIVGGGSLGKRHIAVVRESLPSAEIGLFSKSGRVNPKCDFSIKRLEDMGDFKPQLAIITSSADRHMEDAIFLARKGIHLLIEKPLSINADRVQELIELRDKHKLTITVAYNMRYLPSMRKLRDILQKGTLGRLLHIRVDVGQYLGDWKAEVGYRQSVSASAHRGGGVLFELSHELDYLRWLFGPLDVLSANLFHKSDLDLDVEDLAMTTLLFRDSERYTPIPINVTMDFCRRSCHRTCTIYGSEGTAEWDGMNQALHFFDGDTKQSTTIVEGSAGCRHASYLRQFSTFVKSIRFGQPVGCSIEEGLGTIELINTIRRKSGFRAPGEASKYFDV